ncbi:unnamed protein product [Schistocephalus solidus]|uniref:Uncharacterized protein n=1 Tax=Schistocephalus solidus TaxID=70667 RepID=A0A183TJ27_SCHSO|nr:unnamed protein product [Schistocephalus solidus]
MPRRPGSPTSSSPTSPCADHGDEHHSPHCLHLSGHLRLPATCYLQHHHHHRPQYQRWGLGANLSALRSHLHLTHRPDRLLTYPTPADSTPPDLSCHHTFKTCIGLVRNLRIHRTETG